MLLVVSCPCALVISVPLSFFSGIGLASKKGILVKGSLGIEKLAHVKSAVFDKTGTLTKGTFEVSKVLPAAESVSKDELLALACHAEYFSEHPVSHSIKKSHTCALCGKLTIQDAQEISGHGISCILDGRKILVGNSKLMVNEKVSGFTPTDCEDETVIYVARDGIFLGSLFISDTIKSESVELVDSLKRQGVMYTAVLTGDNERSAKKVCAAVGVDECFASLLPQDKVLKIEQILLSTKKKFGKKACTAFVGDGINDAPVLMRSDVGISMGSIGSDSAVEASDVVIMDDSLARIPVAIETAKRTMRNVIQNTAFSIFVKTAIMCLCIGGFAEMWLAVFGDVGVTLLAVLNSLRLFKSRK